MKLAGREAARFIARPDAGIAGVLLYGQDAMRIALKRQALVSALIGPEGAAEMRLTRLQGADLRRDPAALGDSAKSAGFFPGPRVVLVEDAAEAQAVPIAAALADWRAGDAAIVVTAGSLGAGSTLRRAFEAAKSAVAIAIYDDPPDRDEIAAALAKAGFTGIGSAAMADLDVLGRALDPGDFAQFLEKLALYKRSDPAPLTPEDVAAVAPPAADAELDSLLNLVADGQVAALVVEMRRFAGQSGAATSLAIAAARHFRTLLAAACAAEGPDAALARARPPVFGPRRARMAAQARRLGPDCLEKALGQIMDTDLALRSARPVPGLAMVERAFVRIAMLKKD